MAPFLLTVVTAPDFVRTSVIRCLTERFNWVATVGANFRHNRLIDDRMPLEIYLLIFELPLL